MTAKPFDATGKQYDMNDPAIRHELGTILAAENWYIIRALCRRLGMSIDDLVAEAREEYHNPASQMRTQRTTDDNIKIWQRHIDIDDQYV